jgi:flavin-dependent dehydrogenase
MGKIKRIAPYYDAVVVGARCAGASTALLLARGGARVLVVDRQAFGADTVSTHALMRTGVLQLSRWGVLSKVMAAGTPPVLRTTFHYGAETIGVDIKADEVSHLCAPRRTVLDRVLVEAAREAGAEIHHRVSLNDLQFNSAGRVTGVVLRDQWGDEALVRAGIVIGADGCRSTVAKHVGAQTYREASASSAYVYGYFGDLENDGYDWYFERGVAAGVIPTNGNEHCVFVGVPAPRFADMFRGRMDEGFRSTAAANSLELEAALEKASRTDRLRGFVAPPGYFRQSHGPGWALVGDAGYFKDPLTAHGITDALRDAELLSKAVLAASTRALSRYQEERDALSRPLFDVTDAIASFDWDLDEVKRHHARLSDAMRLETDHVARYFTQTPIAA